MYIYIYIYILNIYITVKTVLLFQPISWLPQLHFKVGQLNITLHGVEMLFTMT